MKKIKILSILILGALIANCQPLPPTTPMGNPVPVDNQWIAILLLFATILLLPLYTKRKRIALKIFKK